MINKELAENVASAIKSCELEGFIYTIDCIMKCDT